MLYYNIILFLLVLLYKASSPNITRFPYVRYSLFSGKYIITVRIKNIPLVSFIRSLSLNTTCLALSGISHREGTFIKNTTIPVSNTETIPVSQMEDEFIFEDEKNPDNKISVNSIYYVLKYSEDVFKHSGPFPLAHLFLNYEESFVHQMKSQGIIKHAVFALTKRIDFNGKLYFGGLPQEELTHTPFNTKCSVNMTEVNWSCNLNAVFFDDKKYNVYINKHYMRFSSNSYNIIVPLDFYEYLKQTVFREYLENKKCMYYINSANKRFIECNCPVLKKLPKINFVIDNVVYGIEMEDIFEFIDASQGGTEYCQFEIKVNENGDYFDIGVLFLGLYNTVFDYEDNSIMFYSDKPFEIFKQSDKEVIKVYYIMIISVLLIVIVYNIVQIQKLKLT